MLAAAAAALALYAGLIGSGHWYGDEFYLVALYRDNGLAALAHHIVGWSPRPVSEPLLFLYARLVAAMGRPLIRGVLGWLWLAFLLGSVATVQWRKRGIAWRVAAGLSLLAMMIVSRDPSQVFFWPVGAVAYLTAIAALTLALFLLADGRASSRRGNWLLTAALVAAAWCCEFGAIFGVCYGTAWLLDDMLARRKGGGRDAFAAGAVVLVLASLLVLGLLATHRARVLNEMPDASALLLHHPLRSAIAALAALPLDLGSESGNAVWSAASWGDLARGILIRAAFVFGFANCWAFYRAKWRPDRRLVLFFAAGVATAWLALAASFYQFGDLCCSRGAAFRNALFLLGLAGIATIVAREVLPWGRAARAIAGSALIVSILAVSLAPQLPGLARDYAARDTIRAITAANWASGRGAGPAMTFRQYPQQTIQVSYLYPPGTYRLDGNTPGYASVIMGFFHKQLLTLAAP
ncbi:MAG: hypothetical protein JO047_17035 [Alphaproteobacteria bacterium]|nr:hypothetical protein [Alphaproteobacteria bacterium]